MAKEKMPEVGDVITSPKFAFGYYKKEGNKEVIIVDGKTKKYPVRFMKKILELGAHDPSRATAKFVVETAKTQGGGNGHGPHDTYPDGWYIRARRLNEKGTYNPKGEVICFYMSGCFTCVVEPRDVKIVGKMQMRFV